MGFFDKVKDVLTSSDAERARTRARDTAGTAEGAPDQAHAGAPRAEEAPARPAEAQTAPTSYRTHTVRHGDTLAGIAEHHGVDPAAMAELNRIDNPDLIYPGQVLRVPPA